MIDTLRALIFDLGGVLLRTEDPGPRTAMAEQYGLTRWALEDVVFQNPVAQQAERGQATVEQVWAEVARRLGAPAEDIPSFAARFFGGDRVDQDLIGLIQRLRGSYTTALLSNTWHTDLPRYIRDDLHIGDTFDVIISSAYHKKVKPGAEIFHLALELTDTRPEQALFVDDSAVNIAAAAGLGIYTLHFTHPEQARRELLAMVRLPEA